MSTANSIGICQTEDCADLDVGKPTWMVSDGTAIICGDLEGPGSGSSREGESLALVDSSATFLLDMESPFPDSLVVDADTSLA